MNNSPNGRLGEFLDDCHFWPGLTQEEFEKELIRISQERFDKVKIGWPPLVRKYDESKIIRLKW